MILVLSGDQSGIQAARQTSRGVRGNLVHEVMSDYKTALGSESGYLRLMRFHPRRDLVEVSTYSPHHDLFAVSTRLVPEPDQHTFELSVPLSEPKPRKVRTNFEPAASDASDS